MTGESRISWERTGFHGRERDFTGVIGFYRKERDFKGNNVILRERTGVKGILRERMGFYRRIRDPYGRKQDFTRNHEILWNNI